MSSKNIIFIIIFTLAAMACKSSSSTGNEHTAQALLSTDISATKGNQDMIPFNSLSPKGKKGQAMQLAANGRAVYAIMVPANATLQEQKAGEELKRWLSGITKTPFGIVDDRNTSKKVISIGNTKLKRAANLGIAENSLGDQGFAIAQKGETLFLFGGGKKGTLNAVFALLEEDLGLRWYSTEETSHVIPYQPSLTFSPVLRTDAPAIPYRSLYYQQGKAISYVTRNRLNLTQIAGFIPEEYGGNAVIPKRWGAHSLPHIVPAKEYYSSHPEYFGVLKGRRSAKAQLCFTNQEVANIVTKKALTALQQNPTTDFLVIGQRDGAKLTCTCDNCSAVNQQEGAASGTLVRFINKIAEKIEQQHPSVQIATLAYRETAEPPRTQPRKNVTIYLCTDSHAWNNPFIPVTRSERFMGYLEGWSRLTESIWIWDYTIDYGATLRPHPNLDVVAQNIQEFAKYKVNKIQLQGNGQGKGLANGPLKAWVWTKLMWDPTRNVEALVRDFCLGYFGKAGPAMLEYNQLLRQKWVNSNNRIPKDAREILGNNFVAEALPILERAEKLAENDLIKARVRIEKAAVLFLKVEKGPTQQDSQIASARAAEELKDISEDYNIGKTSANKTKDISSMVDQYQQKLKNQNLDKSIAADGKIIIYESDINKRLVKNAAVKGYTTTHVDDPGAFNKKALKVPGGIQKFVVAYFVKDLNYVEGQSYTLKMRIRVEKTGSGGDAFIAGVRDITKKKTIYSKKVKTADAGKGYQWYTIANFVPTNDHRIVLSPTENLQNVKVIYLDQIRLEPGGGQR